MRPINSTFSGFIYLYAIFILSDKSRLAFCYISGYNCKKDAFLPTLIKEETYGKLDFFYLSK